MIKAAFFDIDGTLVSFDTHKVPESTVSALKTLREKGIKTFVATGRHQAAINNLGDLEFDGYITLNGGICLEGKDKIIYKHSILQEDIKNFIRYQEKDPFPVMVLTEKEMFLNYVNQDVETVLKIINFQKLPHKPVTDFQNTEVMQLVSFFREEQEEKIMKELPHCEATRWHPLFADVIPQGSSKQVGMDKILEHFGFGIDESIAFGDGGNDISILQHAGIGVAMGNANDDVKEIADHITDSVDNDGIANALKHYGII